MADEQIKVSFLGDATGFESASAKSAAALNNVTQATTKVSTALAQASQKMAQGSAAMGGSVAKGANTATFAMTNLGRVLQDAPYGFIGIANNLNPLLESFQRLKAETGTAGGAIKALGSSLIGGGGLGLALSAVTAAISFATTGFSMWTRGMSSSSEAASKQVDKIKEAKQALETYIESLDDVNKVLLTGKQSAQEQIVSLQTLYSATQNANIPLSERKKLVDELQDQYPKYFANISDEIILAGGAKSAYDKLTTAIIASAKARAAQDQLVDVQKELLTIDQQFSKNAAERLKLEQKLAPFKGKPLTETLGGREIISDAAKIAVPLQKQLNPLIAEGNKLQEKRNELNARANQLANVAQSIVEKSPESLLKPTGKIEKSKDDKQKFDFLFDFLPFDPSGKLKPEQKGQLLDAIEKFSKEFTGVFKGVNFDSIAKTDNEKIKLAIKFDADLKAGKVQFDLTRLKEATEKALKPEDLLPALDKFTETMPQLVVDQFIRGFQNESERLKGVFGDLFKIATPQDALEGIKDQLKKLGETLPKSFDATNIFGQKVTVSLNDLMDFTKFSPSEAIRALNEAFDKVKANLQQQKDSINSAISTFSADTFSGLGQGLGEAIANGASAIQTAANSIGEAMGSLIQQIGKALIQYGIVKTGLDKVIKAGFALPGAAAIAIGVGAIAIGALIKASFANVKKFASGGFVPGYGNSDTVPALLTPGEYVIPKNKVGDFFNRNPNYANGATVKEVPYFISLDVSHDKFRVLAKRANDYGDIFGK